MDPWLIPAVLMPTAGQAADVGPADVEGEGGLGRTGTALVAGRVDTGVEADGVEAEGFAADGFAADGVGADGLAGTGAAGVRGDEHAATSRSPSTGSARRHTDVIGQQ